MSLSLLDSAQNVICSELVPFAQSYDVSRLRISTHIIIVPTFWTTGGYSVCLRGISWTTERRYCERKHLAQVLPPTRQWNTILDWTPRGEKLCWCLEAFLDKRFRHSRNWCMCWRKVRSQLLKAGAAHRKEWRANQGRIWMRSWDDSVGWKCWQYYQCTAYIWGENELMKYKPSIYTNAML